jgi:hypothetical protein
MIHDMFVSRRSAYIAAYRSYVAKTAFGCLYWYGKVDRAEMTAYARDPFELTVVCQLMLLSQILQDCCFCCCRSGNG